MVVLTLVAIGAHVPVGEQVPAGEPLPQSASAAQARVHRPPVQTEAMPKAAHCAVAAQTPFWKTPIGPTGEAQVLVMYA